MSRITLKTTDTNAKIQEALNKYDIITFSKGTYKITQTLIIPSNRVIVLEDAVLRRYFSKPVFMTKADKSTKGYNGACNITVIGGTIEGMNDCGYNASDVVLLFHSKNVTFSNVTFLDNTGSHAIDIGGCKDTNIIGCKFLGAKSVGKDWREVIQIDWAYQGGIPYFPEGSDCFDDTHCDGVNIIGCEFGKSLTYKSQYVSIGTHCQTSTDNYHKNINIKYNKAKGNGLSGMYGFFARLINMRNVNIIGNVVSNYGRFVWCDTTTSCSAKVNKGCRDVVITDNVILNSADRYKASSVWVDSTGIHKASNITVTDNIFDKPNSATYQNVTNLVNKNNVVK